MEYEVVEVARYGLNCAIAWCEATRRAAVIDPGGAHDEIFNTLALLDLEPEVVVVTHGHFDHAGAAARFAARTGARIEGPHRGDAAVIAAIPAHAASHHIAAESYAPARWLDHGDRVRFGEEALEVLHCPGHCAGHVAYVHRGARVAFVGDILFRGAIGAWEHPGGDLPMLLTSIRTRLFPLGDDITFVPGHCPCSTFGRERRENPMVGDAAWEAWRRRVKPG
jgi:glyoxylase-like metal-dependent hydrolase (beta-lactamase superfamily II)